MTNLNYYDEIESDTKAAVQYTIEGETYEEVARIDGNGNFTPKKYIDAKGIETNEVKPLRFNISAENVRLKGFMGAGAIVSYVGHPNPNMIWNGIERKSLNQQSIEETQEWQDTERRLRANDANFDIAGRPLAPNGRTSNLSYRYWVAVRTPSFKRWFGDWENANKAQTLFASDPIDISNDSTTNETAKDVYKAIGTVTNKETGMQVDFVNSAFGKIVRHNGYDPRLIGMLKDLFLESILMSTEPVDFDTPRADGTLHKKKNNIASFTHYVNKFRMDGNDYFIRYTIQDLKSRKNKGGHQFHSQHTTKIKLSSLSNVSTLSMWAEESTASDLKLMDYLLSVNRNTSKMVDENGEPLAEAINMFSVCSNQNM